MLGASEHMLGYIPTGENSGDLTAGVRFSVIAAGVVTHLRYWHVACASVTHHESLYRWSGSAYIKVASTTSLPPVAYTGWYEAR